MGDIYFAKMQSLIDTILNRHTLFRAKKEWVMDVMSNSRRRTDEQLVGMLHETAD